MTADERRLDDLARRHGPRVLAYLTRHTDPPADAADLWQDVLTVVWRRLDRVPDDAEHQTAWMLAVARRALANHRRAGRRRLAATGRLRDHLSTHPVEAELDGGPAPDLRVDTVHRALARLRPGDRELLALTYWDGLTSDQVATVVEASPAATRKRLQRARDRLAAALDSEAALSDIWPGRGDQITDRTAVV